MTDMTKLNQIEELLNTLIVIIQQELQINSSHGIVTKKELFKILQISHNSFKSWENNGLKRLEPPIERTRTIYYKLKDVIDFLTI